MEASHDIHLEGQPLQSKRRRITQSEEAVGKNLNLVAYVRTSGVTGGDYNAEHSAEWQEGVVRAWADSNGHTITQVFTDIGVSGVRDIRPGLSAALEELEESRADGFIVARMDRLARKLTVQEGILAQVWERGATAFSADVGEILEDDPADPMRTAIRQMRGVFAQLDRALVNARLQSGRKRKAERGGFAAYGSPPFGKQSRAKELVTDLQETYALDMMKVYRRNGYSLRKIAERLNSDGFKTKRDRRWHAATIAKILKREAVNIDA